MSKKNDKLSRRLGLILIKLFNGEKININDLEKEFNVSKRTLQRDLNQRLSDLPIRIENSFYFLDMSDLKEKQYSDIKKFAITSGIKSLYPSLTDEFILEVLNNDLNNTLLIKNQGYEKISNKLDAFNKLARAIQQQTQIKFFYNDKKRIVNPYKLVNNNGIWYLVGDENNKLKTYTFNKIKLLGFLEKKFELSSKFKKIIDENKVNWFSENELEVTLEIDNSVIEYFFRKDILANYNIVSKNDEKTFLETKVSYENEILSLVQHWIPNIKIIKPLLLQRKLENRLEEYISFLRR